MEILELKNTEMKNSLVQLNSLLDKQKKVSVNLKTKIEISQLAHQIGQSLKKNVRALWANGLKYE